MKAGTFFKCYVFIHASTGNHTAKLRRGDATKWTNSLTNYQPWSRPVTLCLVSWTNSLCSEWLCSTSNLSKVQSQSMAGGVEVMPPDIIVGLCCFMFWHLAVLANNSISYKTLYSPYGIRHMCCWDLETKQLSNNLIRLCRHGFIWRQTVGTESLIIILLNGVPASVNFSFIVDKTWWLKSLKISSRCKFIRNILSLNVSCLTLEWLSVFLGSASSFSEANYKPSFLPNEELKHLILKVNIPLTVEADSLLCTQFEKQKKCARASVSALLPVEIIRNVIKKNTVMLMMIWRGTL